MQAKYNDIYYVPNSRPPRIEFQITVTNDKNNRSKYFGFKGELRYELSGKKASLTGDDFIKLGDLFDPRIQILDIQPGRSHTIFLDLILDPYQKNVIEDKRDGNLYIRIYLRSYRLELPPESESKQIQTNDCWVSGHRHGNMIEIPTSKWSEIISEAGYEKYQLIELPINYDEIIGNARSLEGVGLQDRLRKASEQLTEIMKLMNEARWNEAVGRCRFLIEALTKGDIKTADGKTMSASKAISELLQRSGFPERTTTHFKELIERLKTFTNIKHHIKIGEEEREITVPMGREDALFTVTTLTTIINLLSRKYRAHACNL